MNYPKRPGDRGPDMPAVSPLDMPAAGPEGQQPRRRIAPKSPRQVLQPETAPPPPPRSQKARHPLVVALNFVLMVIVLVVLGTAGAFYYGSRTFESAGPLAEPETVLVAPGAGLEAISDQLSRHNVIDNKLVFSLAARFRDVENQLQAGEYLFQPAVSMREVLDDLVSGRSVLHTVTFPEGLTSQSVVNRLNSDPVLEGSIEEVPAEGSLMPDTYKFTRGATRQQVLDQMSRAQARVVNAIWARRAPGLPIDTPEQFVTLASVVEKETGRADERSRVAAVFINRLNKGMRLQSDPTVLYGLFGGIGRPADRPIYRSDLEKETPYNTYQISGLPPTPIANPGRAALEAVANPSKTDELYFVADGTGGHAFAATLDEHNRNVARWRQIRKQQENQGTAAPDAVPPPEEGEETDAPATDAAQ